ncbi:MAG: cytochrome c556 [Pseudohongiellaceae bacterium]|jgi:cytochrome c556
MLNSARSNVACLKILGFVSIVCCAAGAANAAEPLLTVKQVMNSVITPSTNIIWGAYQLETQAQWKEIENAALAVIAASNLLQMGGSGDKERDIAQQAQWQRFTGQMIAASEKVLIAVAAKDEEALSAAGNDDLYPPCETCHQKYQSK